jgi:hypothetical protein
MIRGTTAQFKFKLPCAKGNLLFATIKFWQPGNPGTIEAPLPITKKLAHCTGLETNEQININKWNSQEYEEIKHNLGIGEKAWDALTDEEKRQFAEASFDELYISLTAEETLRFSDKSKARVQLRAQQKDGTVFASHQQLITVYPINDDIVTEDPSFPEDEDDDGLIILDGKPIA